jgi:DNA-binding transcriptional ArsR family regulator/uncharacterized protein YndB with AHSA1/START domain
MDDPVFRALGDPTRRALLDRLCERDGQTLGELERRFDMTRFGVMKHLKVLEDAGLVVTRRVGREKLHYLNPVPIREIADRWVGKFAAGTSAALLALRTIVQDTDEEGSTMGTEVRTKPTHVFAIYIRTTPERLWDAITTSEFTRRYYYSSTVDSDWTAGSPVVYAIEGQPAIVGEVIESDPPRKLVCSFDARWDDDVAPDAPSRITWEVAEEGPGVCRLTVVHDGFDEETATFEQIGGGMPFILSGLKTLLETGVPLMPEAEPANA